ncbi:hypothetical protein BH10BDE1_BH10BDE1_22610 [soil metagenome]
MSNFRQKFERHMKRGLVIQLPAFLLVALLVAGFFVYQHFQVLEDEAIQELSVKRLEGFRNQLIQAVDDRVKSVVRMAGRLEYAKVPNRGAWFADANTFRKHLKGLESVAIYDAKNKVKWVSAQSERTDSDLRGLDSKILTDTISEARARGTFTISRRLPLKGGTAFLLVVPMTFENEFVGSLVSVHRLDQIIESFYTFDGYQVQIRESGQTLFSNSNASEAHLKKWGTTASYPLANQVWNFDLTPTPRTIAARRTNLPTFILIAGLLTSSLLAFISYLILRLRQRSKAAERERAFLDTVIDHLPVAVFCNDHENGLKFSVWNKKSEELFGVSRDAIIGKTVAEAFPKVKLRTLTDVATQSDLVESKDVNFEEQVTLKRGQSLLLQTQKIGVSDAVGQIQYSLGISEDISQRRESETRLKDSEQKFAAFMKNTPEMTWIRNAKGEITFANPKFLSTFGVEADAVLGQSWIPGLGTGVQTQGAETDAKVVERGESDSQVRQVSMADGSQRHFLVMKFPMVLSSGDPLIGATAIDVTDRIEAENTLAETTKTLRALIDSSPLPILTLDLSGNVKIWSPACEKVFGWTAEETIGRPLPFVTTVARGESQRIVEKIIAAGDEGFSTEAKRVRKDGTMLEIRIEAMVLNDDKTGKPSGLVAVMNDISTQKIAEKKLQEAKESAEAAARLKADFLANVSHEIRTPLNGIIGLTDILLESGLNQEQTKYATIVQNSGAILLNLINDVLDLSKIDAGKLTLEQTPFSLVSLVETNADLLIAKAREKGLSLMTYVDSNLPARVLGDPSRIAQVIVNLIGNAVKFTDAGGVSIRVLREGSRSTDPASSVRVVFEVQDTGIGLSHAAQEKLFTPFTQAESSTTRRFGGTGLGLSISKNLVVAMGGEIGVQSRGGEGATFWFSLPLESDAKDEARPPVLPSSIEGTTVLIVEEDAVAADIIPRYLRSWGLEHIELSAYEKALQMIIESHSRGFPYKLVLVGQAPNFEASLRFAQEVKYAMGSVAPAMILMTPFESQITSSKMGPDFAEVISKPLKQSQLFDCIVRVLMGVPVSTKPEAPLESQPQRLAYPEIGLRILVADDVSTNQIIALKLLDSLGHFGHSVGDGREALEALRLHPYDIVLMDCQMPTLDGFEATRAIRASSDPRIAQTTIIALTANAMEGDRERCIDAGMNDYLAKPIKKSDLANVLRRWTPKLKKTA